MTESFRLLALVLSVAFVTGCGAEKMTPVPIQPGTPCAYCRMTIGDTHFGGEVVAPGEEPRQYDDIGCLANDLRKRPPAADARVFVADYATGALVPGATAVYSRVETIETPMMSHVVAHADEGGRARDARVHAGVKQVVGDVFGDALPGAADGR